MRPLDLNTQQLTANPALQRPASGTAPLQPLPAPEQAGEQRRLQRDTASLGSGRTSSLQLGEQPPVDINGDGKITRSDTLRAGREQRKVKRWDAKFERRDKNDDGFLTGKEAKKHYLRYDTNGDKKISKQEFLEGRMTARAERRFAQLDRNRDGRLEGRERGRYAGLDASGEGVVTKQEYLQGRLALVGLNAPAAQEKAPAPVSSKTSLELEEHAALDGMMQSFLQDGQLSQKEMELYQQVRGLFTSSPVAAPQPPAAAPQPPAAAPVDTAPVAPTPQPKPAPVPVQETPARGAKPAPARGAKPAPARGTAPAPAPVNPPAPAATSGRVVFSDRGDGPDARPYASTATNGSHPLWYVEPGSSPLNRIDGKIVKTGTNQFHRAFSKVRMGGPGKTLTISYRSRATDIRNRPGSSIVEGAKIGLKWPVASSITGYSKDDPRSVHGRPGDPRSPGSYQFLTGLTEGGKMELSRNGLGAEGYKFWPQKKVGYTPGTWKDITVKVEWVDPTTIRVRYWHNATGTGDPVYEATDSASPFAKEPAFLWLRTDDTDWEMDHLTVTES